MSEHNKRQLANLLLRLELFTKGEIPLGVIVADVEFLLDAIEGMDVTRKNEMKKSWEVLEEVNAVALDGGAPHSTDKLVHSAVEQLTIQAQQSLASE